METQFLRRNKTYQCRALEKGQLNGLKIHTAIMLRCRLFFLDVSNLDLATH